MLSLTMTKRAKCTVHIVQSGEDRILVLRDRHRRQCASDRRLVLERHDQVHDALDVVAGAGTTGADRRAGLSPESATPRKAPGSMPPRIRRKRSSGSPSTKRSIGPSSLWIRHWPLAFKGTSASPPARNFVGPQACLEDRIVGRIDARGETAGIEADALSVFRLVFTDLGEGEGAHLNPQPRSRPRLGASSSASPSSPIVIISMNRAGHRR